MSAPETVTRQELWRIDYERDRYMKPLTNEEVYIRYADIMSNITTMDLAGKLRIAGKQCPEWLEKFTHLLCELNTRGIGVPHPEDIPTQILIPKEEGLDLARKVRSKFPKGYPKEFTIFKYGKRRHLESLWEKGALRLSPASSYNDPSLNPSVKDDELNFTKICETSRITYKASSDYYCFCSAWLPNNRLVADFDADSVLVIREPREFFLRIARTLDRRDWENRFDRLTYVDPLLLGDRHHVTDVPFVKHFRYSYQFEHRLIFSPPDALQTLEPLDIELGPLSDIAYLV